jgi:hypothetical protein
VRQRLQQYAPDDTEDRRVGPDAEPQGEHRHEREARPAQEPPERVAAILPWACVPSVFASRISTCSARSCAPSCAPRPWGRRAS